MSKLEREKINGNCFTTTISSVWGPFITINNVSNKKNSVFINCYVYSACRFSSHHFCSSTLNTTYSSPKIERIFDELNPVVDILFTLIHITIALFKEHDVPLDALQVISSSIRGNTSIVEN